MTLVQYAPAQFAKPSIRSRCWNPPVDIVESDARYTLTFDIPGLERDDINVSVDDNVLTVSGERKAARPEDNNHYRYVERTVGAFTRNFRLPDNVDGSDIAAHYEQGVLTLEIPKKAEAKPRLITVK